jgi:hypothetical protein
MAFYFWRWCASSRGDANFARTQQCEAWRFIFGDGARARAATRTLPARNNAKRRGFWKYYGNILEISWIYHNLRRELGRTLPARNNPKRCGYDLSGIFQK